MKARSEPKVRSIVEAVEILSNITDLEQGTAMGVSSRQHLSLHDYPVEYETVQWLRMNEDEPSLLLLRDTFRVVLEFLRNFYAEEVDPGQENRIMEGVNNIMILVGEAARTIDSCAYLLESSDIGSVTELPEYRNLKRFYTEKIFKYSEAGLSWEQLMRLGVPPAQQEAIPVKEKRDRDDVEHALLDLESVKQDVDYELFFLAKEDASRFFDRKLVRNMKLVGGFGQVFDEFTGDDPLISVRMWHEKIFHATAKCLIAEHDAQLQEFYRNSTQYRETYLVECVSKAVMALMLSSNPRNLLRNSPVKCCYQYFLDFHDFLQEALTSPEYRKLIAYPPGDDQPFLQDLTHLIHALCRSLFENRYILHTLFEWVEHLSEEEGKEGEKAFSMEVLPSLLRQRYEDVAALLEKHPNGSLFKMLDVLNYDLGEILGFDCFVDDKLPFKLCDVYIGDRQLSHLHIPSPTYQEFIHKAVIVDEFKGFLRAYADDPLPKKHLIINIQDRTSWRDHARCHALEELQRFAEYAEHLSVMSWSKDADFYHQIEEYEGLDNAEEFITQFLEHLTDADASGFFFPRVWREKGVFDFFEPLLDKVHQVFFEGKATLSLRERQDFQEIFLNFLQLKILEWEKPTSWSFTCKDGVDVSASSAMQFMVFLKWIGGEELSEEEGDLIQAVLFAPALLWRERNIQADRFYRMAHTLERLQHVAPSAKAFREKVKKEFGELYGKEIWSIDVRFPKVREGQYLPL